MQSITVGLAERSYPIHIGSNFNYGALVKQALIKQKDLLIVTNDTIAPLYLEKVKQSLIAEGFKVSQCILKDGECYKTVDSWMQILTTLLEDDFGRDGAIVALGGGVVGDMAGFAAACYQRGIPFVQMPTTLLSMVDSSVGGKTAFNHPLGKNMIGAFYQPKAVIIDIDFLKTLPKREITAGLGEVVKTGIIYDKAFFEFLEQNSEKVFLHDQDVITTIVKRCCEIKAAVVACDEQEHGLRAILNFGHTFGHALEAFLGFGTWLHGEAVGLGMVIASALACKRGLLAPQDQKRIVNLIAKCYLPVTIPENMTEKDFIRFMRHDKKVRQGIIRYVLPEGIGKAKVFSDISDDDVEALILELKKA